MSQRSYTVETPVKRPAADLFRAIVDAAQITEYFVDAASGPLVEGARVIWHWKKWGDFPVSVKKIVPNELIELELDSTEWKKTEGAGYEVRVFIELEESGRGGTNLRISEQGWKTDGPGLKASHENCGGWQHMAMCLKAYIEHGIDLR